MANKQIVDNFSVSTPDTVEIAYTAPADKSVVIESFTAANNSGVNAAYSCYIKSAAGALQPQVKDKVVVWGRSDLGIGAVNQIIPPSGTIRIETTATAAIYFTISGREVSV